VARSVALRAFLFLPIVFLAAFLLAPLGLMVAVSFWRRAGLFVQPAFVFTSYQAFFDSVRFTILKRSLTVSLEATILSLFISYPIAYFLAFRTRPAAARLVLLLFTAPFLVNYIIRAFAWTYLLGRTGPVNSLLTSIGVVDRPLDWLLYGDFGVLIGLITSYMPFMIFPIWMSLAGIDRPLIHASWLLGASPARTFFSVTLPLSLPGVFAAAIFGFVGCFGESAVPVILGGVGYQLMGNTITSAMDVLNYPLAAAMSSIVVLTMVILIVGWYLLFDMRSFLGKILNWRG